MNEVTEKRYNHNQASLDLPWIYGGGIVALIVLFFTMAPGLVWEHYGDDGGELTIAAALLGVPHPSGYPFFVVLGHFFCLIFGWAGDPAFCTNLLSVAAGAATVAAAIAISLVVNRRLDLGLPYWAVTILACLGTLGKTFWSQAIITEVYALDAALVLWTVAFLVRWHEAREYKILADRTFWAAALMWGLALCVHLTAAFMVFGLLVLALVTDKYIFMRKTFWISFATCIGVVIMLYGLLPILAQYNRPINWGYIRNWSDFIEHVSGAQYQYRMFVFTGRDLFNRFKNILVPLLAEQWGPGSLGLLLVALIWSFWNCTWGGTAVWRSYVRRIGLIWLLLWFPKAFYALNYNIDDLPPYFTSTFVFWGLLFPVAAGAVVRLLKQWRQSELVIYTIIVFMCLIPFAGIAKQAKYLSLRNIHTAEEFAIKAFAATPPSSLILSEYDGRTNALLYERWLGIGRNSGSVIILRTMLATRWYRDHLRRLYPKVFIPEPAPGFAYAAWDPLCNHIAERILIDNATWPRFLVRDTLPFTRRWRLVPVGVIFRLEERDETSYSMPHMRGRFRAIDLVPFANADYRGDPFLPGLRPNDSPHFPELGEGELKSDDGIPFWIPPPWGRSGSPSVITTCYLRDFKVQIPILSTSTVAIHLAVAGGVCREASGPLAFLRPHYADGPGERVAIADLPDYRDLKQKSLRFVRIALDPSRQPISIEITSGSAVSSEPFVPGVAIFAMTQELLNSYPDSTKISQDLSSQPITGPFSQKNSVAVPVVDSVSEHIATHNVDYAH